MLDVTQKYVNRKNGIKHGDHSRVQGWQTVEFQQQTFQKHIKSQKGKRRK